MVKLELTDAEAATIVQALRHVAHCDKGGVRQAAFGVLTHLVDVVNLARS